MGLKNGKGGDTMATKKAKPAKKKTTKKATKKSK